VRTVCGIAVDGRRAARALAEWVQRFELGEPEFLVIWCLHARQSAGLDQTSLAKALACSPAQISATVERLRVRGWIETRLKPGDRRRHVWQLAARGEESLAAILLQARDLRCESLYDGQVCGEYRAREFAA
jgi:DNA-binding MarR family transcriptional regulator